MSVSLRHVGLVVRDMERMLAFYRDGIGLRVVWDKLESGPVLSRLLQFDPAIVRTVKLVGKGSAVQLELLAFDAPATVESSCELNHAGFTHIALTVSDLGAVVARLDGDVSFNSEEQASPDGKVRLVFCRDPEGNFLELVEVKGD